MKPFVAGGTTGIGECAVRALAATFAGREDGEGFFRVYIVGTKRPHASSLPTVWHYIQGRHFDSKGWPIASKGGRSHLRRDHIGREGGSRSEPCPGEIDFLVCCQEILPMAPEETEGLDKYFCLFYYMYSRMCCIERLLPLLVASPKAGHVVSVFNSGIQPSTIYH
ncbi:hypothetical protein F4819DRAFT_318831 [Hypoxylon fuscum]|nr:hypothetical protein F4819DRAFT_318831 [Hypoxylon fuscum]